MSRSKRSTTSNAFLMERAFSEVLNVLSGVSTGCLRFCSSSCSTQKLANFAFLHYDKSTSVRTSPCFLYLMEKSSSLYVSTGCLRFCSSSCSTQKLANFAFLHYDKSTSVRTSPCFLYLMEKSSSLYVSTGCFRFWYYLGL